MNSKKITHALLSVSDKEGIVSFAKALADAGIILLSTGGTAKLLKDNNIPVEDISTFTGFPEIMGGRVKTLHPKLYGGILARAKHDDEVLLKHGMPTIGLVVVNLYPFEKVIKDEKCTLEEAIENIDIGGPSLLRAAAKNYSSTTAVVAKEDYDSVLSEIERNGETNLETRFNLAKKVFAHIARYDAAISNYFSSLEQQKEQIIFPHTFTVQLQKNIDLRYGENPHQKAAFYIYDGKKEASISSAVQLSGKPLSYNNIADADAALECVKQFDDPACVIVKHANPCAVSIATKQLDAYKKAFKTDPTSAFGGIIAFNTPLEIDTLQSILENQFVEVIIAPEFSEGALDIAKQKPNTRLLMVGPRKDNHTKQIEFKSVSGGILLQESDTLPTPPHFEIVSIRHPSEKQKEDLLFAWKVVRFIKSNAIVYAKDLSTIGIGPGQTSRVFSTKIAALKAAEAGLSLQDSAMASDAFFPFRDSIDEAANLGISAIIQPGGSVRDNEIIKAADEHNLVMVFTHTRHFRH